MLRVARYRSLGLADHLSRGVLPSVVCLECDHEALITGRPWPTGDHCSMGKKIKIFNKFNNFNPLSAELNPICHLLALLGPHHILHISRVRVNGIYKM